MEPPRVAREDRRERLGRERVGLGAEMGELGLDRVGPQQPDAGPLLAARLGEHELAAVGEAQPEHRRLRALRARREVADPAGAHQVHHQRQLAVVGREEQPLRPPPGAREALALERRERRVERLQRGDVSRAGLLDRASAHVGVEGPPPGLDFGQLRHGLSLTAASTGSRP